MTRSERLLALIQLLRQHRYAVTGRQLAEQLGISLRTVYRDIASLQAQGANIDGEAGVGYSLRPGFMLPPLMFTEEEIEALVLGSRWVAQRADDALKTAANQALAKISAMLPEELRRQLDSSGLLIGPVKSEYINHDDEAIIRHAIRKEYQLQIEYSDVNKQKSQRIIRPLALGFLENMHVIVAWCELRQDFRHFRTDRVQSLKLIKKKYSPNRQTLLKKWRTIHNIPG